ncbi:MAG TPA: nuclear transport factor 2 family protein [Amaricoccus sp.]|uniref:YybH family protein n=1 Tax=Amaricoccus sp. TaxID=1872485 RepID=UPI002C39372B|nr:nuclear transport factor 2 family protein [Amaricoccus sp.]HMQ94609.1 nuclear transport factor 2 family protein [Amaricoccus sp.]HMR51545.1 nuclear transport factor 2 family protein [Amaricoccus sp.]HMR59011.1 nuclear transport factor 2 family protein [Amaricoccus sp.]HMT98521.1 nuclear transport factor 2 family protein [Amaricoccus sp.]
MAAPEDSIRELLETRRRALHDRDAEAFLAAYAAEAEVFDLAPPLSHGPDPAGVAAWMASWDGPIGSETRRVAIRSAGGVAFVAGLERLHGRQGGEARDIWMRFTLGLVQGPEGWRIAHEHVSVPVRKTQILMGATDLAP